MGEQVGRQDRLFYEFCLDDVVPADHLLRRIDSVLDLSWLRRELSPFYSHTGCPSVDPELLIRMMLIGYCYSIRSDRRLCRAVGLDLAFRWFCRLGLEDGVPSHATFSVNRHGRFRDSDILRKVFEAVVRQCMVAGLVKGEGFAVDASVIEADASRFKRVEAAEIDWSDAQRVRRPVREYLAALDGADAPTNPERAPKALSPTDPCAAWTTRGRHKVMFGYSLNSLIDMEQAIIVDVPDGMLGRRRRASPRRWRRPSTWSSELRSTSLSSPNAWPATLPMGLARASIDSSDAALFPISRSRT